MNILVSSDKNYLDITATMLYSVYLYNKEELNVWFLNKSVSQVDKEKFTKYLYNKCNIKVFFIDIKDSFLDSFSTPLYIKHISIETYFRLIAQFLLPSNIERILWLDSDIIIKGNLFDFYHQDINNLSMVACENMGESKDGINNRRRLNLPNNYTYFNAGVLLLNIKYLRENTSMEEILTFCQHNKDIIKLQDQDVLNMLYHKNVSIFKDQLYNCLVNSPEDFISADICEKTNVIHYAGIMKPWKYRWQDKYSQYYWQIKAKEGMKLKDWFTYCIGNLWKWLHINSFIKISCMPYNWLITRISKL